MADDILAIICHIYETKLHDLMAEDEYRAFIIETARKAFWQSKRSFGYKMIEAISFDLDELRRQALEESDEED